ncbi:hypothetical protein [Staphylococcus gallinarum]|uniref:hypothetical protein n=1 Tax=Staphylococcus gallinarum TaxID=1293 RepID=UPI001E5FBB29|nr:hypothetical protein [Staphylococcus gallinarum]MCD8845198.1 hypothetical protein [Staphylococcus gallinarum]
MYIVEKQDGSLVAKGGLLSELIEHTVFLQIQHVERNSNVLTRLHNNLYKYLNQLSCFYNLSEEHAALIEFDWSYIENFLSIYNQSEYISESDFITITKELKEDE